MRKKIKFILVISIIILSSLVINWNYELKAKKPANDISSYSTFGTLHRLSDDNFDWSQIGVLSEPIIGQNNNLGNSEKPKVAVENDKVYVVWEDESNFQGSGNDKDIFYRYFNGSNWSEIQVISEPIPGMNFNTGNSEHPAIAVENGSIHVVWLDNNNTDGAGTDYDIFYRCNLTGTQWNDVQVISEPIKGNDFNTLGCQYPAITVENSKIYVVWYDRNNTNGAGTDVDTFYRCNLTGTNWEDIQVISEPKIGNDINTGDSLSGPSIAVENSKIYITWEDNNNTNGAGFDRDIYFRCNLSGSGWEDIELISEPAVGNDFNIGSSFWAFIMVENSKLYLAWNDNNNTNGAGTDYDIFFRCNLTGTSWEDVRVVSEPEAGKDFNTGNSYRPKIAVENSKLYLTWYDNNNTNGAGTDYDIFLRCNLTGTSWEDVQVVSEPETGKDFNTGNSYPQDIAIYLGKIYVVWRDDNNTNGAGTDYDIFFRYTFFAPVLSNPNLIPILGNTSTYFNFTVIYTDVDNDAPTEIMVNISGKNYSMMPTFTNDTNHMDGKNYYYNITHLNIGQHNYQFRASDGDYIKFTELFIGPEVYNTPPNITTPDNQTAIEDTYYEVTYEYDDIDRENVAQPGTWNFSTNATWLSFNPTTAMLYGTPTNDDVGSYWVYISINDTIVMDFTNFTLSVLNKNDDPIINTTNVEITYEDELYEVDYNATDIDSTIVNQIWSLDTNATSWLDIDSTTGIISGTPTNDEVGSYRVNVSVDDGDTGLAFTNFTLIVLNVNDRPEIITEDELIANANILYMVDYNATDIDSPLSQLTWSLDTNATSWLDVDSGTGVLSGTPSISDLGWFNVNISVDDGDDGEDWHEFILTVITEGFENEPPEITTIDKVSITAGESYNVIYEAIDDRTSLNLLVWSYNSNASWLSFNKVTRVLSGNPTLSHVGWYWVNITVNDGEGGFDFHNFTLTVYSTANEPPDILTEDDVNAVVGEEYSVDYDATDDRTPLDKLQWSLETNTSDWLGIDPITGVLSGTPELEDVGSYWVKVSVFDDEDGWDHSNFTLWVTTEPITNLPPELSNSLMTPSRGNTDTDFTFSVQYSDDDNDAPTLIRVIIDNESYNMTLASGNPSNGTYEYTIKLSEGVHIYYYKANDGIDSVRTDDFTTPYIEKASSRISQEDFSWLWLILIIVVIIVILILLFIFLKKKKGKEEEAPVEEAQPPPPEEPSPEEPPPEQPLEEVPPEQVQTPESPTPEQPPPTPEVTPQVVPQVEPAPQPAPIPQVEEQPQPVPIPQVEQPQPQVAVQEPPIVVEHPEEPQPVVKQAPQAPV